MNILIMRSLFTNNLSTLLQVCLFAANYSDSHRIKHASRLYVRAYVAALLWRVNDEKC